MFNDFWLDYTRAGGSGTLNLELLDDFNLSGRLGILWDFYELHTATLHRANEFTESNGTTTKPTLPVRKSRRVHNVYFGEFNTGYDFSNTKHFSVGAVYSKIMSVNWKEFERSELKFTFKFIWTFPSVRKSLNYTEKFTDPVYLIGQEDYGYIR